jgi:hypothetical protein
MRVEYYKIDKRVITQNPTLGIGDGCHGSFHRAAERVHKWRIEDALSLGVWKARPWTIVGNVFEGGVPYSIFEDDGKFSRLKRLHVMNQLFSEIYRRCLLECRKRGTLQILYPLWSRIRLSAL